MAVFKKENKTGKNNKVNWVAKFYYKDFYGNTKQKKKEGFATQREAKEYERAFLDKANASNDMLFSSLKELYFEHNQYRLKITTIENKKVLFKLKILPYFKDMKINEIKASTISKWQNELISLGYSDTYLKTIHNQLSAIFNFAMKYYGLNENPARINGSMGKKNAESMQFYTLTEFKKFISYFDDKPATKIMFELLFWTGIRSGELFALTKSDINFVEQTLTINKSYARVNRTDVISTPKTLSSKRIIVLPIYILDRLRNYIDKLPNYNVTDRLFPYSKSFLSLEMKRASTHLDLKRIRVHDLRHSHASLLINEGFSPLSVKERLGHKDIHTTLQTYSHLYPDKQSELLSKLNKLT